MTCTGCGQRDQDTSLCRDCGAGVCEECAGLWDVDGGYGEGGACVHVFARCRECEGERDEKRQRREARNDSGV